MKILQTLFLLLISMVMFGQDEIILQQPVSVDREGSVPDESAVFDIQSNEKGVLIPRMSQYQRTMISNPATGLLVFDYDQGHFYYYNGVEWEALISEDNSALWSPSGNSIFYQNGTVAIGTDDFSSGNSLLIDHFSSSPALEIDHGYSGTSSKTGIDLIVDNNGNGNKRGVGIQVYGTNSEMVRGLSSYIISGSDPDGTYHSIDATVSGIGTAVFGKALDQGLAAELDGDIELRHSNKSHYQVPLYPEAGNFGDSTSIFFAEDDDGSYGMFMLYEGDGNELMIFGKSNSNIYGPHFLLNRTTGDFSIPGDMSIGSTNFADGYRLCVDGKAICEELQVDLQADWPDYVFSDDYELMSLENTRDFIDANGHLPGMTPAEEIDANGLPVGETQRKMMEKIEELTLHMIRLHEENKELKERLSKLESRK